MLFAVAFGLLIAVATARAVVVGIRCSKSRQAPLSPEWTPAPPESPKRPSRMRALILSLILDPIMILLALAGLLSAFGWARSLFQ
jgi:hypothetical protein